MGTLLIVGGGKLPDAIRRHFIDLAGGKNAHVVIIPTQHEHRIRSSAPVSITVRRPPPDNPAQPILVPSTSGRDAR